MLKEKIIKKAQQEEKKSLFACAGCEKKFSGDDLEKFDKKYYCEDCLLNLTFICFECDKRFYQDDIYLFNYNRYCDNCLDEISACCDNCGDRFHNDDLNYNGDYYYCNSCDNDCGNSCDCDVCRGENSNFEIIKIPFEKKQSKTFKENPYKNLCGVEIECLNNNIYDKTFNEEDLIKYGFSQIDDGSLNSNGVEFVSNAFNGDLLFNKINDFVMELNKRDFRVNSECGLHVHIKIKKDIEYLKKIISFYNRYEKYIFEMLPHSRKGSTYCYSIKNEFENFLNNNFADFKTYEDIQQVFYNIKNKRTIKQLKSNKHFSKRYCWLNLHSLFYRGTIEIRNHSATLNHDKIKNWLNIHLTILNFIDKLNLQTIFNLPQDRKFFLSLFDKDKSNYIIKRWLKFNKGIFNDEKISFKDNIVFNEIKFNPYWNKNYIDNGVIS